MFPSGDMRCRRGLDGREEGPGRTTKGERWMRRVMERVGRKKRCVKDAGEGGMRNRLEGGEVEK